MPLYDIEITRTQILKRCIQLDVKNEGEASMIVQQMLQAGKILLPESPWKTIIGPMHDVTEGYTCYDHEY
jgi:hypothetical protein